MLVARVVIGTRPGTRRSRGFTLVEMVVSLSVVSIVFLAMGSVMMLATKAMPSPDDPIHRSIEAADVLQQISSELEVATLMKTADPTLVEFEVPDRDGDSNDEVIKYEWSGTAGDPLLRTYNSGPTVTVLESVTEFALGYTAATPTNQTPPEIESAEQLFLMQDSSNSGSGGQMSLGNDSVMAQVFQPTLPADASSWRITRVMAKPSPKKPTSSTLFVQVRPTSAGEPSWDQVVDEVLRAEADLLNNTWQTFTFANAGGLDPNAPYAIALGNATQSGTAATVKIGVGSINSPDTRFYWTSGGNTWVNYLDQDLWVYVYGTYSTLDPDWTPTGGPLDCVSITLNPTVDPVSRHMAEVPTLNQPEMP